MSKLQAGFTLIELVVVIVVLGILAAVAVPQYVNLAGTARTAVVDGTEGALVSAAALFIGANTGTLPTATQIVGAVTTGNGVVVARTGSCTFNITPPGGSAVAYSMVGTGLCQ